MGQACIVHRIAPVRTGGIYRVFIVIITGTWWLRALDLGLDQLKKLQVVQWLRLHASLQGA